jgi:hypothetical protein
MLALVMLLPITSQLFIYAIVQWLYRHLSVSRASSVVQQDAPRAGEVGWEH